MYSDKHQVREEEETQQAAVTISRWVAALCQFNREAISLLQTIQERHAENYPGLWLFLVHRCIMRL